MIDWLCYWVYSTHNTKIFNIIKYNYTCEHQLPAHSSLSVIYGPQNKLNNELLIVLSYKMHHLNIVSNRKHCLQHCLKYCLQPYSVMAPDTSQNVCNFVYIHNGDVDQMAYYITGDDLFSYIYDSL